VGVHRDLLSTEPRYRAVVTRETDEESTARPGGEPAVDGPETGTEDPVTERIGTEKTPPEKTVPGAPVPHEAVPGADAPHRAGPGAAAPRKTGPKETVPGPAVREEAAHDGVLGDDDVLHRLEEIEETA
ncbi:hypothetical protein ACFWIR_39035, partial [Streptomyces olivaceus]